MRLETPRLLIRPWSVDDAEQAFETYGDPEVTRYLGGGGKPQESIETQRATIERIIARHRETGITARGLGFWPCIEKESGRMIGAALLLPLADAEMKLLPEVEIGWHLAQSAWGKGYATEAAQAVLTYALDTVKLDQVTALVFPENTRSIRVTEKLGMAPKGLTDRYFGLTLLEFQTTKAPSR